MSLLKSHNDTSAFFESLDRNGKIRIVPSPGKEVLAAGNARLEKMRRESILRAHQAEVTASKVVFNA